MPRFLRRLLVLHGEPSFQTRLRWTTRESYTLELVSDWESLAHTVRSAAPGVVVLVDPYRGQGPRDGPAPALHGLLLAFPSVTVVATLDPWRRSMHDDILHLGSWGVVAMLDPGSETTVRGVFHRLENARLHTLRRVLEAELAGRLGPRGEIVLEAALHVALERGHVRDLARRLHLSLRIRCCAGATPRGCQCRAGCCCGRVSSSRPISGMIRDRACRVPRWRRAMLPTTHCGARSSRSQDRPLAPSERTARTRPVS